MAMTAGQLSRAQRWVVPGAADLFFVGLLLTQIRPRLFADTDTGWHLWAGFHTLAHGPGPIPDALSFTRAGQPWLNPQWLAESVMALLYRHAGFMGLAAMCVIAFATAMAWLYRVLVREARDPVAAGAVTLITSLMAVRHVLARPSVLSFALFIAAWELTRRPEREAVAVVALPLLTALWANLHPTAFLAPALVALAWWQQRGGARRALTFALSVAALGATPFGFSWMGEVLPTPGRVAMLGRIDEWQSADLLNPGLWPMLAFLVLALLTRHGGPALRQREVVFGIALLTASLLLARLAPFAAILWSPFLARDLAHWVEREGRGLLRAGWQGMRNTMAPFEHVLRPGLWPVLASALLVLLAPRLGPLYPATAHGFPLRAGPEPAVREAERLGLGERVFNAYRWGGYLTWAGEGRWKVFIDSRAGLFAGDVVRDYLRVLNLQEGWKETLGRHDPDWVLVSSTSPLVSGATLSGDWRVAFADRQATILVPVVHELSGSSGP